MLRMRGCHQEVQKKIDKGKWKRLLKTDRKEILMTPVEEKENIRVGSKRGFQLEAVAKDKKTQSS